jgi:hypothetical protein
MSGGCSTPGLVSVDSYKNKGLARRASRPTDDSEPEPADGYQATRAFYTSAGFLLARDFQGLWESDIPVLLVKQL